MNTGLTSWKSKVLSPTSRLTLVGLVTSSIPTYTILTTGLPMSTNVVVDKLNRHFLWDGDKFSRAMHLMSWNAVCYLEK